jgi:hypothetical protein
MRRSTKVMVTGVVVGVLTAAALALSGIGPGATKPGIHRNTLSVSRVQTDAPYYNGVPGKTIRSRNPGGGIVYYTPLYPAGRQVLHVSRERISPR